MSTKLTPQQQERLKNGVEFVFSISPVAEGVANEHLRVPRVGWFRLDAAMLHKWLRGSGACSSLGASRVSFDLDVEHAGIEDNSDYEAEFLVQVSNRDIEIVGRPANGLDACQSETIGISDLLASFRDAHEQHDDLAELPDEMTLSQPQWFGGALLYNELCWPEFMKLVGEVRPDLVAQAFAESMGAVITSVDGAPPSKPMASRVGL